MNIIFNKKNQASIEFIIILIFLFLFISGIIYIIGMYLTEFDVQNQKDQLDNFAKSIEIEINTLNKIDYSFEREVEIPPEITKIYNLTLVGNYLILQKLDYFERDDKFYYSLPEPMNYLNYSYKFDEVTGNGKFIFRKIKPDNYDGIILN